MRLFLVLLLAVSPALAQDAVTPDGGRYYGALQDGQLHGRGRLEWRNGARYEGDFVRGLMHGKGTFRYANGDVYEGDFRDGLFEGQGRLRTTDGEVYEGGFKDELYHGKGRFQGTDGEVYEGDFAKGEFTGKGTYTTRRGAYTGEFVKWRLQGEGKFVGKDGQRYEGGFKDLLFQGQGVLHLPNGDVYRGSFADGQYHGEGTLTYAKPPPGAPAEKRGTWRYGYLDEPQVRHAMLANVEAALRQHGPLLERSLAALAPREPGRINMYVLAVAGDGTQEVFRREVEFVREQLDRDFGTRGRSLALVNSRTTAGRAPMATASSIREALNAIAARMDKEQDILFLFLTSHGSRGHDLVLQQSGVALRGLSARELGEALRASGIRWKAVVVSACYSGGFIEHLKDERTLVITAARHDRQSFGCADENDFTYFGKAFFHDALPASGSFQDAFRRAERLVAEREPAGERSLPQMHNPAAAEEHLRRWWSEAGKKLAQ